MQREPTESLEELRRLAEAARARLDKDPRKRPLFVEFSGSPKSGKSTCIDVVSHFLRRTHFRVLAPTEGASKRTPYYLKDDFVAFNVWSATYALTHVLEGLYHSDKYEIAILDRGLFDALGWFELLASDEMMTRSDADSIQRFLLINKWRSVIDLVLLFTANPQTSMERENRDKLISEPGRAMNPDFLDRLNNAYQSVHDRWASEFPQFETINTSSEQKTTPQATDLLP